MATTPMVFSSAVLGLRYVILGMASGRAEHWHHRLFRVGSYIALAGLWGSPIWAHR